jgi:octaprenyl-diphosphate synthase
MKRRKQEAEVRKAISLLRQSGAIEKARADARHFGQLAKDAIAPLRDNEPKRNMLRLVDFVLSREA